MITFQSFFLLFLIPILFIHKERLQKQTTFTLYPFSSISRLWTSRSVEVEDRISIFRDGEQKVKIKNYHRIWHDIYEYLIQYLQTPLIEYYNHFLQMKFFNEVPISVSVQSIFCVYANDFQSNFRDFISCLYVIVLSQFTRLVKFTQTAYIRNSVFIQCYQLSLS